MIDKAELRVPAAVFFRPEFRFSPFGLQYGDRVVPLKRSKHYVGVADLRPFGIDALLHANYRYGSRHDHKLELLGTGKKTLRQMAETVTSVFDVEPNDLEMMRVDLAADISEVPVSHMHKIVRVRFKRFTDERGVWDYEIIGNRKMQYLRYGKSPNCVRIYDKPAECKARFAEIQKRVSPDADPLTFEQVFGFPEDAVLTRIERQAGGGRIPAEMRTFGNLKHAAQFNPFTGIEIVPENFLLPDPKRFGIAKTVKLVGTHTLVQQFGLQEARAMLNIDGNAKRYMDEYREYLRHCGKVVRMTEADIYQAYRASVSKQINGESAAPSASLTYAYPVRTMTTS